MVSSDLEFYRDSINYILEVQEDDGSIPWEAGKKLDPWDHVEAAMGLSICGRKSIVELQFSDFITSGFNPVVNYLAKSHYRWVRMRILFLECPVEPE